MQLYACPAGFHDARTTVLTVLMKKVVTYIHCMLHLKHDAHADAACMSCWPSTMQYTATMADHCTAWSAAASDWQQCFSSPCGITAFCAVVLAFVVDSKIHSRRDGL
jgi:hypothetical protein